MQDLANNAEMIYDLSIERSFNPELVIIRAVSEGFSPGGSTNNYWGIGCYNGSDSCFNYPTLSDGILDFINIIQGYGSTSAYGMMLIYSYIGDYWINPGNSSDGGCYYFPYIKKYLSASRASIVEEACASGACEACVETTDEDQSAYAQWQVSEMVEHREDIFGISCD